MISFWKIQKVFCIVYNSVLFRVPILQKIFIQSFFLFWWFYYTFSYSWTFENFSLIFYLFLCKRFIVNFIMNLIEYFNILLFCWNLSFCLNIEKWWFTISLSDWFKILSQVFELYITVLLQHTTHNNSPNIWD